MLFNSPSSASSIASEPPKPPTITLAVAPIPPPNIVSTQLALAIAPLDAHVLPSADANVPVPPYSSATKWLPAYAAALTAAEAPCVVAEAVNPGPVNLIRGSMV